MCTKYIFLSLMRAHSHSLSKPNQVLLNVTTSIQLCAHDIQLAKGQFLELFQSIFSYLQSVKKYGNFNTNDITSEPSFNELIDEDIFVVKITESSLEIIQETFIISDSFYPIIEILGQLHQHSTSSFYACRSWKCKKAAWLDSLFCALGVCMHKSCS